MPWRTTKTNYHTPSRFRAAFLLPVICSNAKASGETGPHEGVTRMNDAQLDQAIAAKPHQKVTKEGIEARIISVDYMVMANSTVTICNLILENGYSVRGESACVDPRNFDMEIGRQLAYRDAINKIWPLEGYLLAECRFQAGHLNSGCQESSKA
jgi:hypothetical protein